MSLTGCPRPTTAHVLGSRSTARTDPARRPSPMNSSPPSAVVADPSYSKSPKANGRGGGLLGQERMSVDGSRSDTQQNAKVQVRALVGRTGLEPVTYRL
jgi:hypothetical protein